MAGFKFKVAPSVPAGSYRGRFVRAEEFQSDDDKGYGPGLKLVWTLIGGQYDGSEVTRIVSQKFNPKTNLYKFVVALKGGALASGEEVDLDSFAGVEGMLILEEVESGGTRVGTFLKT